MFCDEYVCDVQFIHPPTPFVESEPKHCLSELKTWSDVSCHIELW